MAPGVAAVAGAEQIAGPDLVLPCEMTWGAGFIRNQGLGIYGPRAATFGHSGWGGSCAFADPERRISGAYVMNRQSAELIADPSVPTPDRRRLRSSLKAHGRARAADGEHRRAGPDEGEGDDAQRRQTLADSRRR